jgi:hypothetical protein
MAHNATIVNTVKRTFFMDGKETIFGGESQSKKVHFLRVHPGAFVV